MNGHRHLKTVAWLLRLRNNRWRRRGSGHYDGGCATSTGGSQGKGRSAGRSRYFVSRLMLYVEIEPMPSDFEENFGVDATAR